jgi:hypothetical protein
VHSRLQGLWLMLVLWKVAIEDGQTYIKKLRWLNAYIDNNDHISCSEAPVAGA